MQESLLGIPLTDTDVKLVISGIRLFRIIPVTDINFLRNFKSKIQISSQLVSAPIRYFFYHDCEQMLYLILQFCHDIQSCAWFALKSQCFLINILSCIFIIRLYESGSGIARISRVKQGPIPISAQRLCRMQESDATKSPTKK